MPTREAQIQPHYRDKNVGFFSLSPVGGPLLTLEAKTPGDEETIGGIIFQQSCATCPAHSRVKPACPGVAKVHGGNLVDNDGHPLHPLHVPGECKLLSMPKVNIPLNLLQPISFLGS